MLLQRIEEKCCLDAKTKDQLLKCKIVLRSVAKKVFYKKEKIAHTKRRFLTSAHRTLAWCTHSSCVRSYLKKIMETVQKLGSVDPRILELL